MVDGASGVVEANSASPFLEGRGRPRACISIFLEGTFAGLVYVASRPEPRRASLAGKPFLGLDLVVEANDVFLLPAEEVRGQQSPHFSQIDWPGVKRNLIGEGSHHSETMNRLSLSRQQCLLSA